MRANIFLAQVVFFAVGQVFQQPLVAADRPPEVPVVLVPQEGEHSIFPNWNIEKRSIQEKPSGRVALDACSPRVLGSFAGRDCSIWRMN